MLSIPDMAILGAAALMFFGPEQLPKVARQVGIFMRDVQNTSQQFIREMERAADDPVPPQPDLTATHDYYQSPAANGYHETVPSYEPATTAWGSAWNEPSVVPEPAPLPQERHGSYDPPEPEPERAPAPHRPSSSGD
jgi:sec-independent protein translocase protein TatA